MPKHPANVKYRSIVKGYLDRFMPGTRKNDRIIRKVLQDINARNLTYIKIDKESQQIILLGEKEVRGKIYKLLWEMKRDNDKRVDSIDNSNDTDQGGFMYNHRAKVKYRSIVKRHLSRFMAAPTEIYGIITNVLQDLNAHNLTVVLGDKNVRGKIYKLLWDMKRNALVSIDNAHDAAAGLMLLASPSFEHDRNINESSSCSTRPFKRKR